MAIWRLMSYHEKNDIAVRDQVLQWYIDNDKVALGCGLVGNIQQQPDIVDSNMIGRIIDKNYPQIGNGFTMGPSLWHFYSTVQPGDYIIIVGHRNKKVVRITDGYEFDPNGFAFDHDYKHYRLVKQVDHDIASQLLATYSLTKPKFANGHPQRRTLSLTVLQANY